MTSQPRTTDRFRRLVTLFALVSAWALACPPAHAQTAHDIWITDGPVYAMARDADTLYIGGFFGRVGPATGSALMYDPYTAEALVPWPAVAGNVNAVVSDGAGGWYIGGSFTTVQGQSRNNLAHLDAHSRLTAWNPNANGAVNALLRVGTTIYVGGGFTLVSGIARSGLAAVDTGGVVKAWNPVATGGAVYCLAASSASPLTIYAGGAFGGAGIVSRNRAAAFDTAGTVLPWNPNANGIVYSIAVSAGTVYMGGSFTTLNGGTGRGYIAAVDPSTGTVTSWNPVANTAVYALATARGIVYAGGFFTTAGGQPRNYLAAIDSATGLATGWNPNPNANGYVRALTLAGGTIYVGGKFTQIGGQARLHLAVLDTLTGQATPWAPQPNDEVDAIGVGASICAGGLFTSNGGVARNNIAAIDLTTGDATSWNPSADNLVEALAVSGGVVYAGGGFQNAGGQHRNYLAALDQVTGAATAWNPIVIGADVHAMIQSGSVLYIGGGFTTVGGMQRYRLAAIDTSTGVPTAWHPATNNSVYALALDAGVLYAGGLFTTIGPGPTTAVGDSVRLDVAAVDASSGAVLPWNANLGGSGPFVEALAASGGVLYIGGIYTNIGGQSRRDLSALDLVTALATGWNPNPSNEIKTIAADGGTIYVGGTFTTIGTNALIRNRVAALDAGTGAATAWDANAPGTVNALTAGGGLVSVGGVFTTIDNRPFAHVAVFTDGTAGVAPAAHVPAARLEIVPNPSRGAATLRFRMPAGAMGEVAIYDLAGRRVRVLARGGFVAGDQRVSWDGRDASGHPAAPGIYFARVHAGTLDLVGHVLRLQ